MLQKLRCKNRYNAGASVDHARLEAFYAQIDKASNGALSLGAMAVAPGLAQRWAHVNLQAVL